LRAFLIRINKIPGGIRRGAERPKLISKPSVSAAHPPLQKLVKNRFENINSFPAERVVSLDFLDEGSGRETSRFDDADTRILRRESGWLWARERRKCPL
jgi:hypothetical protein